MADTLTCEIVTPERLFFSAQTTFVAAPATEGEIGIMKGHVPLVSTLGAGKVRVTLADTDGVEAFAIAGGYIEVQDGEKVIVLADHAAKVADIDLQAVQEEAASLEEQLAALEDDAPTRPFLTSKLDWAKVRITCVEGQN